jgi:tetratricopeptide (TPR) repeat protein
LDGDTTSKQPDRASKSTEPEPLQPTTPQKPPHTPSPPRYAPPPPPIAPKSKHRPSASPTPGSNDPYGSQRSDPPADPQILENTAKGGQLRFQHLLNEAEQSRQQYQKSRSRSDLQRATTRYRLALKYAANQEQHSQTLWQFGLLYLHAKQHTQADNYFQQSIALLPRSKHINAYRRLVDLYSQAGYNSGAMGYLQRLIQLDPPNAPQYRRKLQRYQK